MSGKASRAKGRRGELEVLRILTDMGIDAEIRYGQEELGGRFGDIESSIGNLEVKRRKGIDAALVPKDDVRIVAVRMDRGTWLAVVRLEDALRSMNQRPASAEDDATQTGPTARGEDHGSEAASEGA